jgi:dTDP-4-amino-4,6-dideoxygalactose transaminase
MQVKYSYLEEQFKDYQSIFKKIAEVVKTGDFTLGKTVQEFEEKFANLLGARYGVGVNSGTDALFLSLKVIGVGPGSIELRNFIIDFRIVTISFGWR